MMYVTLDYVQDVLSVLCEANAETKNDDDTFKQYCKSYSDAKNQGLIRQSITNCEQACNDRGFSYKE